MNKIITQERRASLHAIVDRIEAASQVDENGELTPEACAALDELNGVSLPDKIDAYYVRLEQETGKGDALKALATKFTARAAKHYIAAERMRERLLAELGRVGVTHVKGQLATLTIEHSQSVALTVPEDQLPDEWTAVSRKAKRADLLKALKSGASFAFATIERSAHVRFR